MTKEEYINYWKITAAKDWKAAQNLFKSKDYVQALFWSHLVIEKLLKANWIKNHESNFPPKVHNLSYLVDSIPLSVTAEQRIFIEKMNAFQLEGRYPDYQNMLYKTCNKNFTETILAEANKTRLWLLKKI